MKRIIIICIMAAVILAGCSYSPSEQTYIFPVIDYLVAGDKVTATFEYKGSTESFTFDDEYIYCCEYESRIIGIGSIGQYVTDLRMYLYLSQEDYENYILKRFGIKEE